MAELLLNGSTQGAFSVARAPPISDSDFYAVQKKQLHVRNPPATQPPRHQPQNALRTPAHRATRRAGTKTMQAQKSFASGLRSVIRSALHAKPSPFTGKVAVVTGAASGIGYALAMRLARAGATVIATDVNELGLEKAFPRKDVSNSDRPATLTTRPLDVANRDAFFALIDDVVRKHSRLDYLFNNAGVGLAGDETTVTDADWHRVIDVNLWGAIHGCRAAYPIMRAQGFGHIVNVASGAGLGPRPGMVAYATSKWAVVGLSISLRAEAKAHGIHVTAVAPGAIATDMLASTTYRGVDGERLVASVPVKSISADECARRILRALNGNPRVVPIGGSAVAEYLAFRYVPSLYEIVSDYRAKAFRKHATSTESSAITDRGASNVRAI